MSRPEIAVLVSPGINCQTETSKALDLAGGKSKTVLTTELISGEDNLKNYQGLVIPGGFSYGDHIASGIVMATELDTFLRDQVLDLVVVRQRPVLGICNGFQVLVQSGLLPFRTLGERRTALMDNDIGHFRCDWVDIGVNKENSSPLLEDIDERVTIMMAHGEGKSYANPEDMEEIAARNLVALRYIDKLGNPTLEYPANPNGSLDAIAGITDPSGLILGMMPHPERFIKLLDFPNWRREDAPATPQGSKIFENFIKVAS